ncbi:predicted protein [Naegleria gruberi]|uniref:Predicted protein n=1 Tax=Naegleria gruberi TaxID=5762 RepID=D2W4P4_NAEGR|nr:uncharacterized protein NAEGRDRAFT_76379 [Naegleria gruberi]EFC35956.1 predicted protein [Naegleria gruberi]|eukprot:XP_002668700.1 predicted protein [Naegleria gruberi strain NEG-M]
MKIITKQPRNICLVLLLLIVALVVAPSYQLSLSPELRATCLAAIQSYDKCTFYTQCLEKIKPCGPNGYALGYGYKYCSKFFSDVNSGAYKSEYAQKWVSSTGHCLQKFLMQNVVEKLLSNTGSEWNCERIIDASFNSHPGCYTDSISPIDGQKYSICKLRNVFDVKTVLMTVDAKDLLTARSMKQIVGVLKNCMSDVLSLDEVNELNDYL